MLICKNCLEIIQEYRTAVDTGRSWSEVEPSLRVCCNEMSPINIEEGDLETYEENWESLDFEDLTEKEEVILNYLTKEGRITYVNKAEIHEDKSSDSMVRDKQLGFDFL